MTNQNPRITSLRPRLTVADAARAIEFYVAALGGEERERYVMDGKIVHAVIDAGEFSFTLKDEGFGDQSPTSYGGTPVFVEITTDDVDALGGRMTGAGASVVYPIEERGEEGKGGRFADPFGHIWMLSQAD